VCNVNNATNGTSCGEEGTCSVGVCELPEVDAGSDAGSDAGDAGGDDAGAAGGRGGQGGQAGSTGTGDDAGPMAGTGGVAGFPNIFKPDGGLVPDAGAIIAEFVEESGVCECTLPGNMNSSSTGKAGGWALLTLVGLVAVRRRRAA
jgi:MYXO-CTERM domain-containing protein